MATYVVLVKWTEQGAREAKALPHRIDTARELLGKNGGQLINVYMTMGGYDAVSIIEAPSDEVMAKVLVTIGSGGKIRTTTLKAFGESELRQIVGSLEPRPASRAAASAPARPRTTRSSWSRASTSTPAPSTRPPTTGWSSRAEPGTLTPAPAISEGAIHGSAGPAGHEAGCRCPTAAGRLVE